MKSNALLMALLSGVLVACGGGQDGTTATPNSLHATVEACAVWDAATVYTGGQCVVYQGVSYKAKWWTQGNTPSATDTWGPWAVTDTCLVGRHG